MGGNIENVQEYENPQCNGITNDWCPNYWNGYTDNNYWYGVPGCGQNPGHPTLITGKRSFDKGGSQNPVGEAPMTDPGGKLYQDSDRGLKKMTDL